MSQTRPALKFLGFLPVGLFAALIVVFAFGLRRDPSHIPSALINRALPQFSLAMVPDDRKRLSNADLAGKVVLVNVFASWCGACRIEQPTLLEISTRHRLPIYGLAWKDDPANIQKWLRQFGNPYTGVGDDSSGRLALDLGVTGAPETFVVDHRGVVRYKAVGPITQDVWEGTLAPIIARLEKDASS